MKLSLLRGRAAHRSGERGVTMILVALAMVAIIAMAALSIDVVTLYLAREETQRAADSAALAATKVLALSGITGDPGNTTSNWSAICGSGTSPASLVVQTAQAVASQNGVGGISLPTTSVTVTYSAGNGSSMTNNADCTQLASTTAFGVNPMVTVKITRSALPTFFSRIWGNTGNNVSATATAEAFNPSNSGNAGNQATGTIIPVQPRCVKPWMIPNMDPLSPATCTGLAGNLCQTFVSPSTGQITNPGISTGGGNANGVIGERFWLIPNCRRHPTSSCTFRTAKMQANYTQGGFVGNFPPNTLEFLPGQVLSSSVAIPSGLTGTYESGYYEEAIAGCDQSTVYQCGVPSSSGSNAIEVDTANPQNDTTDGVMALINEGNPNPNGSQPTGQDYLNNSTQNASPTSYPFQFYAGTSNSLVTKAGLTSGTPLTVSNSIVSLPIFDDPSPGISVNNPGTTAVTVVGFLQVFINSVDQYGNMDVLVLNVAGCSNGAAGNADGVGSPVTGSSPVPVRLVTPP